MNDLGCFCVVVCTVAGDAPFNIDGIQVFHKSVRCHGIPVGSVLDSLRPGFFSFFFQNPVEVFDLQTDLFGNSRSVGGLVSAEVRIQTHMTEHLYAFVCLHRHVEAQIDDFIVTHNTVLLTIIVAESCRTMRYGERKEKRPKSLFPYIM